MRDLLFLEFVRTQEDRMSVALDSSFTITRKDTVSSRRKVLQTNRTDLVKGQDVMLAWFVGLEVAVGLPLASCMLDFDVDIGKPSGSLLEDGRRRGRKRSR